MSERYSKKIVQDCKRKYLEGWSMQEIAKHYNNSPSISVLYKWKSNYNWNRTRELIEQKADEKMVEKLSEVLAKLEENQLEVLVGLINKIQRYIDSVDMNSRDLDYVSRALFSLVKAKTILGNKPSNTNWEEIFEKIETKTLNEENKLNGETENDGNCEDQ